MVYSLGAVVLAFKTFEHFHFCLFFLSVLSTIALSAIGYMLVRLKFSSPTKRVSFLPKGILEMQRILFEPRNDDTQDLKSKCNAEERLAPVISRNIDQALNDILDLASRDYIFYWFGHLMLKQAVTEESLKRDLWQVICSFKERMAKTDQVKILAIDLVKRVSNHFEKIRLIQDGHPSSSRHVPNFTISPHLVSAEREIEYLGKVSEALIIFLFPASYGSCLPIRHILREVFARHLLYPAVDLITNPDLINGKILAWIQKNQSVRELDKKTFIYADSFEEFVTMINNSHDIGEIKQMRYNILTEIMQATTMNNLHTAKGAVTSTEERSMGSSKSKRSDLLSPQNMKRYINQLVHVKGVCEKRLNELGCDRFGREMSADNREKESHLTFEEVMESPLTRKYFYSYLEEEHHEDLLGFWAAVDELKSADRTLWHQLGTEIFYGYINKPSSVVNVRRPFLKRIEAFLIGDDGPDVLFELQSSVSTTLQDTYFPAFLFSDKCFQMIEDLQSNQQSASSPKVDPNHSGGSNLSESPSQGEGLHQTISDHSGMVKSHLELVSEKLQNKLQALAALKSSLKPESKVLTMLQSEVDTLKLEHREVKNHIVRTESWAEHLGRWRCHVQAVEHNEDKEALQAYLIIYIPMKREDEDSTPSALELRDPDGSSSSTAWSCIRKMTEFHHLQRELVPYVPWIKTLDLPSNSKSFFSRNTNNKGALERARSSIQRYMDSVLNDEFLHQSEIVYAFLSPSPHFLKSMRPLPATTANKASSHFSPFSNFFNKAGDTPKKDEGSVEEELWLDDMDAPGSRNEELGKDIVAETLYGLIGEVFDMRGVFKWMRKSLMTFVQITYGSTINRQVRETVTWLTSEQMILYYLHSFKKSFWPQDSKASKYPPSRTPEQRLHIRAEAREALLQNIPEVLINLVGQQAAANGTSKVFEVLQNSTLNKQLFYDVMEPLMFEVFPELTQSQSAQQIKSFSM
eukprot:snap_masked-scaffold204_size260821-processed-gene-1.8 protein:Tk07816 transcript:snap_masked-scaffold204_size260821-processed-gene-1.8-mRNA-1 annotation:"sorting nexin-25"